MAIKVKINSAATHTLATMPYGSFGRHLVNGRIYFRTSKSAVCLDDPGSSYSECADLRDDKGADGVEVLPRGSTITITVE